MNTSGVMASSVLTGCSEDHLVSWQGTICVHSDVVNPLQALISRGKEKGFDLAIASGFRSFERQLLIWNAKARGQRLVLDSSGNPLNTSALTPTELMYSILRWSALPGASRHHWGTDLDLWDRAAVAEEYQLQLVTAEYELGGPFADLAQWLGSEEVANLGFYRPYDIDRGGVAPEPWHLSYRPLSQVFEQQLTPQIVANALAPSDIMLKAQIIDSLDEIFHRFVCLTADA